MIKERAGQEAEEDEERALGEPSSEGSAEDKAPERGGKEDTEERTITVHLWKPRGCMVNRTCRLGMA